MTLRCQILGESVFDGLRGRPFGSMSPLLCSEERSGYLKIAIATNHCPNIKVMRHSVIGLLEQTLTNKNQRTIGPESLT